MQRPTLWSAVALAVLAALALFSSPTSAAEDDTKSVDGVSVTVEVWRSTDAEAVKLIEALTTANPGDSDGVRKALAASDRSKRLSRFVTPTQIGKPVSHSDFSEKPVQVSSTSAGGISMGSFGGFSSEGTELEFVVRSRPEGRFATQLKLKVSGMGTPRQLPGGAVIPGDRFKSEIEGAVAGRSGVTRMFISQSASNDLSLVFVTATKL